MNTIDDLLYKAKELGKTALNAAQEMADIAKVKFAASQLRSEITANYQKLGEITFELARSNTDNPELIRMCVAEIEKQLEQLSELEDYINELKKVVRCAHCGASNVTGSLYCARCGAPIQPGDQRYASSAVEPTEPNA